MTRPEQILEYVTAFISDHGYSPTVREIAQALGFAHSTVHGHLITLAANRRITWEPAAARTVRPVETRAA